MAALTASLLGICLVVGGSTDEPIVTAADFGGWFEAASRGKLRVPESAIRKAVSLRYVFVGGLGSERMPAYFAQNAAELRALGVPKPAIHFIHPSSRRTVEENLDEVRDEFRRVAGLGDERLVVIAHSRGACDALAFALHHPEFVDEHVEAMFLIQGPFGGTALADYVVGDAEPMDDRMSAGYRWLGTLIGRREAGLLKDGRHAGMAGLTREDSRAYWRVEMEDRCEAARLIGPKVFFVETESHPARLRLFQRTMGTYLGTYYGPNDGLVAVDDQSLPGLGTSLGVLDAGHADLTRRFPATRTRRKSRRAIIGAVVMVLGRMDSPVAADSP
ncbi:alpha/beta hydrolase [Isosphaeraceae bacterium EP7]